MMTGPCALGKEERETIALSIRCCSDAKKEDDGILYKDQARMMGMTKGTLDKYRHGQAIPGSVAVMVMARYYGCSADYLLGLGD